MKTNFDRCLSEVLQHEGGWVDDPHDPGGATMKGITIGTYRQWKGRAVTKAELRAISNSRVEMRLPELPLPEALDLLMALRQESGAKITVFNLRSDKTSSSSVNIIVEFENRQ